jgi:RNA polymerase sigma-70 factor (ECF subfamily)
VDELDILERETVASAQRLPACPALGVRAIHGRRRGSQGPAHALDPKLLVIHTDALDRAARALRRSHNDAEDLVQETFARVVRRPRLLWRDGELGYLLRALRNTHATRRRAAGRRPLAVPILDAEFAFESEGPGIATAREGMSAITATPKPYHDAVVAVDVWGLSYEQAASHLQTQIGPIARRLSRGREYVAQALPGGPSR